VIDVDALGHAALASAEVTRDVVREFGRATLSGESGTLDRRALAKIAFGDDASRRRLEAIVHPVVRVRIDEEIRRARADGAPLVVVDCALLFESGLDAVCDATVDVDAPEPLRLARAAAAHGWDAAETRRRAAAQLSAQDKRARADRVFVNDGDEARLSDEARAIFETVRRGAPAGVGRRRTSS
jgi:dephospho-CoA kinase